MGVVGGDEVEAGLLVELYEPLVDPPLLGDAVVLHLEVDGVEDLTVLGKQPPRLVEAALEDPGRNLGREAT